MALTRYGLQPLNFAQPPMMTQTVAPTYLQPQMSYAKTSLSLSVAASAPSTAVAVTAFVDDATIANRWSKLGINTNERLLAIGASSKLGRWCLKLLAGSVPLLTDSTKRQTIDTNVQAWLGQADLLRTGMQPVQAKVMQQVGVFSARDLANYANAYDQSVLLGRYATASGGYGVPTSLQLAQWVSIAQSSPSKLT